MSEVIVRDSNDDNNDDNNDDDDNNNNDDDDDNDDGSDSPEYVFVGWWLVGSQFNTHVGLKRELKVRRIDVRRINVPRNLGKVAFGGLFFCFCC
jgi:hypothetical protein